MRARPGLEGDLQAVGKERDENVRFDPGVQLMVDGTNTQVALELFERLFDFGELDIPGPELDWIVAGEVGAQ